MKRILGGIFAFGVCLTPITLSSIVQPSWAQTQNLETKIQQLKQQALQQSQQGKPLQSIKTLQQLLTIARQIGDRKLEAFAFLGMGFNYHKIGQPQEALKYYQQALPISQSVGDRAGEAVTLNNIGLVYDKIGQPQEALKYYQQALPISREVGDRAGEAVTLDNIGAVYDKIGQPQEALKYYDQALPISQSVGDRAGEATTLNNIGAVYRDTNQPSKAIEHLEQSLTITLEMRRGLLREHRKDFLEAERGTAIALTDILIKQNQRDKAFEWINLATTTDLADYTRLIDAQVANPEAQKAIDDWKAENQQLEFLRQQLQDEFSEEKVRQIRELEAEVNRQAEAIADRFPEVAELFETQPTDITQLRNNIPQDTLVIQPVLLTGISNVPNTVAFFLLTQDTLEVIQTDINPQEFNELLMSFNLFKIFDFSKVLIIRNGLKY
ncbi:MAG: tetratricopeptide repeat protein [Xenococcaceae cyanobacterium]